MLKGSPFPNLSPDGSAKELVASSVTIVRSPTTSSKLVVVTFCPSPFVLVFLAGGGPPCPSDPGSDRASFLCSKNEAMSGPPSLCCGRGELELHT